MRCSQRFLVAACFFITYGLVVESNVARSQEAQPALAEADDGAKEKPAPDPWPINTEQSQQPGWFDCRTTT